MKTKQSQGFCVKIINENGDSIESYSPEANFLFMILEKLEEIRCGIIDVEMKV